MARVVVLDIDGTLMDTNYLHVTAWARAFAEVGVRAPTAEIHKQVGRGSEQLIREFVEDKESVGKVNGLHDKFYGEVQEQGYPLPGAKELISDLSERGYEVWFATSAKPDELENHQKQLESEGRISGIINSSDVENSKPAPDTFGLVLERAGASPEETVAVGDTIWDVKAAKAAGIRTVSVLTGGAFSEEEFRDVGAVEVYKGCEALLDSNFPE